MLLTTTVALADQIAAARIEKVRQLLWIYDNGEGLGPAERTEVERRVLVGPELNVARAASRRQGSPTDATAADALCRSGRLRPDPVASADREEESRRLRLNGGHCRLGARVEGVTELRDDLGAEDV
jgi:hypothetical protein